MSEPHVYWRSFPSLERLYTEGRLPEFLANCERSCQELDAIIQGGDPREAERARAAMTAYGHTLQLIQQLAAETSDLAGDLSSAR